jgi:CxxC-x17-CxxC domain-containing protein
MEFHKVRTGKKKFGKTSQNYRNDNPSRSYRNSRNDRREESTTVTCADCGNECQVPFVPKNDRPVFCSDCFRQNKPRDSERDRGSRYSRDDRGSRYSRDDRGSRYSRDDRGSRYSRDDRGSRYSRDDRGSERFSAQCDNCGDDCDLPFKPKFDRPVYCSKCFSKIKLKEEEYEEDEWSGEEREQKPRETFRERPKKIKSLKKMESFYSGGSDKFYNTLKEKLFEILGGKVCSSCGFKDEKALGFKNIADDDFDSIQRGGFASSWGKYISDPSLAKEDLKILCLNCNAIQKPISSSETKAKNIKKKKKRFPR